MYLCKLKILLKNILMKKLFLSILLLVSFALVYANDLVFVPLKSPQDVSHFREMSGVGINYQCDEFLICTTSVQLPGDYKIIEENAWQNDCNYYLLWVNDNIHSFINDYQGNGKIIFASDKAGKFVIVKTNKDEYISFEKEKVFSVVHIDNIVVPEVSINILEDVSSKEYNPLIATLIQQINQDSLEYYDQHLQNFGTRKYDTQTAVQAQNWIKSHFDRLGYSTELQTVNDFITHNVIATKVGTKYPDQYVVCGCHYDSYTFAGGVAPGADDNGTGTAGMMEIARILSNYNFDRTIIICCFTAEEIGLYGSAAYAARCQQQGMNIIGYFNIDMSGYLQTGSQIHTSVIYPSSAESLYNYYKETCGIYLPNFIVEHGNLSGGDSDHTSFNNHGYMGIYPFEDAQHYSPYIHTAGDTIGMSVNNFEQVRTFTMACMSNVLRMSYLRSYPHNLTFQIGENNDRVILSWDNLNENLSEYKIYRNNELIGSVSPGTTTFTDTTVNELILYKYFVTAVYADDNYESDASNIVKVYIISPLTVPFTENWDVNDEIPPCWVIQQESGEVEWTLAQTGIGYPPYPISMPNMIAMLGSSNGSVCKIMSPRFNFSGLSSATLKFLHSQRRKLTSQDVLKVYYKNSAAAEWQELATYTSDSPNWRQETVELPNLSSDYYIAFEGALHGGYGLQIDNINVTGQAETILGDANNDGQVNISDVMTVIAYMLNQNPSVFIFNNADVNTDGQIDVRDIIGVINIITR